MKRRIILALLLSYVCASAFLFYSISGRVTYADLLAVVLTIMALWAAIVRQKLVFPHIFVAVVPLFCIFLITGPFAVFPERVALEFVVILFGYVGALAITNLIWFGGHDFFDKFCRGYVLVLGAVSVLSLIDFIVWPALLASHSHGGLAGPFRNTGQAGSFFGVHLVICVSLLLSGIVPRRLTYLVCVILVLTALILTLKRAAIAGFVIGTVVIVGRLLFSRSKDDKRMGAYLVAALLILSLVGATAFFWALDNIHGMLWRFQYKFSADAVENFQGGFLADNIKATMDALTDRPLFGVGLDNVRLVYFVNEIHSTYLGILAYGGMVGITAYAYFMSTILMAIFAGSKRKLEDKYTAFLYYLFPLFLGLVVSWGYTYHIRKREFWLLLCFIALCKMFQARTRKSAATPATLETPRGS